MRKGEEGVRSRKGMGNDGLIKQGEERGFKDVFGRVDHDRVVKGGECKGGGRMQGGTTL